MKSLVHLLIFSALASLTACRPDPAEPEPNFSEAYRQARRGQAWVEIPEVYELVQVLVALSPAAQRNPHLLFQPTGYYRGVQQWFSGQRDHPAVRKMNDLLTASIGNYPNPLRSALGYEFTTEGIRQTQGFPERGFVAENRALLEEFARLSAFRAFYRSNLDFYQHQIEAQESAINLKDMWAWLETRFPDRYDHYLVVMSPLALGFHFTNSLQSSNFRQTVMYISTPHTVGNPPFSPLEISQLGRIVFTEIDHNYVNPVTARYERTIRQHFNYKTWNNSTTEYQSAVLTFNEYLTWAVYSLYLHDTYPPAEREAVIADVERVMLWRGFPKFVAFNREVLRLYQQKPATSSIADLYPALIEWTKGR